MKMMVNLHSRETKASATESVKEWYFGYFNFVLANIFKFES